MAYSGTTSVVDSFIPLPSNNNNKTSQNHNSSSFIKFTRRIIRGRGRRGVAVVAASHSTTNNSTKDSVLQPFHSRRALKCWCYLDLKDPFLFITVYKEEASLYPRREDSQHPAQEENLSSREERKLASTNNFLTDKGGATHVDIACVPELVELAVKLTSLPICVSSVDPAAFIPAVDAGAQMIEIGNYDSFYEMGKIFSSGQILKLTQETKRILPFITLSVTVPHTLNLPDQVKLAELLEKEGADIIQTEGGKCSSPSNPGVLGLIEKATPTLAAAYSIARAVKIPVMCSSGLSAVTAPMAISMGAAGVGVGSAVNKLNDVVAMIAEVRSIADSLGLTTTHPVEDLRHVRL